MPIVTTSDALIKAAEDMSQAVKGVFPTSGPTQEAIEQLMRIFKEKVRTEVDSATVQRVLRKEALSQRVHKEAEHASDDAEMQAESTTPEDHNTGSGPNFISQDDDIFEEECESPARRTRSRTTARTITQEVLMQVMDITTTKNAFSAKSEHQESSRPSSGWNMQMQC